MILRTKRLILRPWCEADAEDLYTYASDPEIGLSAGWMPHVSVVDSREFIREVLCKPTVFAVCLEDGHPIGNIHLNFETALRETENECELGYWLGRPFWGQGLIPEAASALLHYAFDTLGVQTVWCGYYEGNNKSRRVQEKLGFMHHHTDAVPSVDAPEKRKTVYRTYLTKTTWKGTSKP